MLKHSLPIELKDEPDGNLKEILINGKVFNGYAGKVTVPDYIECQEERRKEEHCIVRKFRLALKKGESYRSGWLKVMIPYTYPPYRLKVWTANSRFPSDIYSLGGQNLYYGDVCYGTMIPAVTLYDPSNDIGLTIAKAFGRTGGRLSFNFGTYHEEGMEVEFKELAFESGKIVEIELLMSGHKGCWRPGLEWLISRYPEYFYPENKDVWKSHGAFAITSPFTSDETIEQLPIKWCELHNHFPRYSDYAPEESEWDSVVLHDYPELTSEIPGKISPELINERIRKLHQHGIKVMLYIQVSGDCYIPRAEKEFPDSIARDSAGNLILTWKECCFLNASEYTSFGQYVNKMIDRFLARYPEIDGVFLDRLCYQCLDFAHSDGKTAVQDKPAAEYGVSYEWNLSKLSEKLHRSGKLIWANGPFDIEAGKWTDGIMSEGTSGISETHKYLCVRKPILVHTYPTDEFKTESMLKYCMTAGAAWSYGGSSTLRNPPVQTPEIRKLFAEYLPLIEPLISAEILLEPDPFKLPPACRGEIFRDRNTGNFLLTLLPQTRGSSLSVMINIPHGSTAQYRGNLDTEWHELTFEQNTLNIPNKSQAYTIRFKGE